MNTDASEFISDLDGGVFAEKMGRALSLVAGAVTDHDKTGKITITLEFKRIGNGAQVMVNHKLAYVAPTRRGKMAEDESTQTPMHIGTGGRVTFFPENQNQMFTKQGEPVSRDE